MSSITKTVQFIGGHNVNANWSVRKIMHKKVIGTYGIKNHNKKGENLLGFFGANNQRVVNSFFKKRHYTTQRSFNKSRTPHMLDIITCSTSFFKCVQDCGTTPYGIQSNQYSVRIVFFNLYIRFKSDYSECPVIDWKNIKKSHN